MRKIMFLVFILSIHFVTNSQVQASSLNELCAEFASNQVARNITISYSNNLGSSTVINTTSELFNWCLDNFHKLNLPSSGWETYGVPISNITLTAATVAIAGAGLYLSYKQYKRSFEDQSPNDTTMQNKLDILETILNTHDKRLKAMEIGKNE